MAKVLSIIACWPMTTNLLASLLAPGVWFDPINTVERTPLQSWRIIYGTDFAKMQLIDLQKLNVDESCTPGTVLHNAPP